MDVKQNQRQEEQLLKINMLHSHLILGTLLAVLNGVFPLCSRTMLKGGHMEPGKILTVENPTHACDCLTNLVENIGFRACGLSGKANFLASLRCHNPDLLLIGSSVHVAQIETFTQIVERERKGLPILFIRRGEEREEARIRGNPNLTFLPNNFAPRDLKVAIQKLVGQSRLHDYKELDSMFVGQSPAMVEIKRRILQIGKSDLTVLICGESGTGKEVVARAIHRFSPRAHNPFIKVNSAGLPTSLLESELFGFEKGAFTGAYKKKPGKFQLAHSGTLLLDEIGDIPLPVQAKFLQVLEDKELSPLGSTTNTRIDARVLAATNANIDKMVSQGHFRLDLYYRINAMSINIPPLRDRKEDIDLLCDHFLKKYATGAGKECEPLSDRIREQFHEYSWTGNVRELENVIQGIMAIGDEEIFFEKIKSHAAPSGVSRNRKGPVIAAGTLKGRSSQPATRYTLKELSKKAVRKAETGAIVEALSHTKWNRKKAAVFLKVSYRTLLSKIKEYQIEQEATI
jgi:two-component system response regulator AtoC